MPLSIPKLRDNAIGSGGCGQNHTVGMVVDGVDQDDIATDTAVQQQKL